MKKSIIIGLSVCVALSMSVSSTFAQVSVTPQAKVKDRVMPTRGMGATTKAENHIENLKTRAQKELTRRLASLNKLATSLPNVKRLSADQKAAMIADVQTQITSLTALQTKINQDTDEATLKADVQSIVSSYRIYGLYMPKIEILVSADKILTTNDALATLAATLQTQITAAQSKGQDVTSLNVTLSDMQAKIADAKTQSHNAITTVTPLTPDGYPANKTSLTSARDMLKVARNDSVTALADAKKIIKSLVKSTVATTPAVTP
jgi:hypothetical protein